MKNQLAKVCTRHPALLNSWEIYIFICKRQVGLLPKTIQLWLKAVLNSKIKSKSDSRKFNWNRVFPKWNTSLYMKLTIQQVQSSPYSRKGPLKTLNERERMNCKTYFHLISFRISYDNGRSYVMPYFSLTLTTLHLATLFTG